MLWLMMLFAVAQHRIVSIAPSITEILFALGAGDQVVGVTTYCYFPEAAKSRPKVGGYATPSLEAILALRPDQVIMMKNRPDIAQKLRETGIDVTELQAENLAGVYETIQVISEKIGVPQRGRSLVQSIRKELQDASAKNKGSPKPKVLFIVGRTPGAISGLTGVGPGSFLSELITLAGAENILADAAVAYPKVNMEEVIRRNPDVIIDMGHNERVTASQKQAVKQLWRKYSFLRAVQRDAVFPISADYFVTPSPRVVLAVKDIQKMTSGVQ